MVRLNFLKAIFSKDVILLVLIGLALLVFSVYRRDDAFPAASLDLKVNKKEAVRLAQNYALTTGFFIPSKIVSSAYFNADDQASTFLEYEYPLSEANELMRKEIPIWQWKVHLLDIRGDELEVGVGVNGNLHSFERDQNKEKSLPSVSHQAAQNQVTDFAGKELHVALHEWKLISDAQSTLPRRTDHSFIWEDDRKDYKGAHLRVSATVSGDKLSRFNYSLHVPDSFEQKFKGLRAQNRALADLPIIVVILFALSMPVIFLRSWTKGQLRVKFAIICGVASATVSLLTSLNDAATIIAGTSNWAMDTFLAKHFINDISSALIAGVVGAMFFGAAEIVYRNWYTNQVSLEILLGQASKALRTISVAKSAVLGMAIFGITTGYQVAFFLIGKHYGLWNPLGIHDRSVIDSFCPAWDAMSIGIRASTTEELGFRIFMMIIFQRMTKSFWLANLLQAVTWSFGHCNYAVEPPYARGVELGILGLFYGWIMRRYGVLSLILGHYAFDVYLSVQTLFGSHELIDWASAYFSLTPIVVLPTASMLLISRKGIIPDQETSNASVSSNLIAPTVNTAEQEMWPTYKPISKKQILLALIVSAVFAATLFIPKRKLGDEPVVRIDHDRAIALARNYFQAEKFNVDGLQATAWMSDDTNAEDMQYVSSHATFEQARKLERMIEPRLVWNVRLFKPGDPNVFYLRIGPDGAPVTSTISIDEMASGAKLTEAQATELATKYLTSLETPNSGHYKIFDSSKLEHPNRTDYTFIAENPAANVGLARFQVFLKVVGENISDVRRSWSMPEDQHKKVRRSTTATDIFILIARLLCALVILPNIGYWIFTACKKQTPNKYVVSSAVLVIGAISILEQINYMSRVALWAYHPTEPIDTHLLGVALGCLTRVVIDVSIIAILAAVVSSSYTGLFVSTRLRDLFKSARPQIGNSRIWSDAILIGLTAALVFAGFASINEYAGSLFSTSVALTRLKQTAWLEQSSLIMASLLTAMKFGLLYVLAAAAILRWSDFYTNQRAISPAEKPRQGFPLLVPIFIAAIICVINLTTSDPAKMFCTIGTEIDLAIALYLVLEVLGNRNYIACFFAAFFLTIGKDLYYGLKHLAIIHAVDLMVLYGIFVAPILWMLSKYVMEMFRKKPPDMAESAPSSCD